MTNKSEKKNLLIYQKYIEFVYYTNDLIRKYPKCETFALVKEIKVSLYSGLRSIIYAVKVYSKQDKLKYLNDLDVNLNVMKIYIRLSYKYKYISLKNYQSWSTLVTDLCNMLGAWVSACLKR